ncbi:MAG: UDP-glucose 4-epimerase GalE [Eubacteriales bacterium]
MKKILVTGGAGYIGSHTCVELLNSGYEAIVIDNLSNSDKKSLERVKEITGRDVSFYEGDILDAKMLGKIFSENKIYAVIHFAGLKAVGESVHIPLDYYKVNIAGTVELLKAMAEHNVKKMVFSSSATVYGMNNTAPYVEDMPLSATNPYGSTKVMIENILDDLYVSDAEWAIAKLRYFNPIGAHKSGKIGENPNGIPNNLMPYITQVAVGKREHLGVFGDDYNTPDGTGVRDYIHVCDLAIGHLKALETLDEKKGSNAYNLGAGKGYSVLDVVKAFEKVNDIKIPYKVMPRRAGDIDAFWADTKKAEKELNFKVTMDIEDMCRDSWNWQKNNPNGYDE